LSGNRRNPYAIRKTNGFNKKGYPIYINIGYAPTREEGLMLLAEYNRNPYDIDTHKITVEDVYKKWSDRDFPKLSKSLVRCMKAAWNNCKNVYKLQYRELKAYQMQECIDSCGKGYATQGAIKNLFGHLDRFALELDIIVKCNSTLISALSIPDTDKKPFTDDEITAVWSIQGQEWVDSVLVFLYTGFRISELLGIETANVNLEEETITAGVKTKAGKNRIVPIHPKIMPFIQARAAAGNKYLFSNHNKKRCSLGQYYITWRTIMNQLDMQHTPHELRHTFRSRLDSAGANKVCIDLMMGHKSNGTGERIYTHKTIQELKNAINLLN
jgi:integrase